MSSLMQSEFSGLVALDSLFNGVFYLNIVDLYGGFHLKDYGIFQNLITLPQNKLFLMANTNLKSNYSNDTNYLMNFDATITVIDCTHFVVLYMLSNSCTNILNCVILAINKNFTISGLHYLVR